MSAFFFCLVICAVAVFFFAGLLMSNIWADVVAVAFLLAILITVFVNQDARIAALEQQIRQLQSEKELPPEA